MATSTLIPLNEYLATAYRPDCDYIDGEIQERNVGEYDHGHLQITLGAFLLSRANEWHIRVITELRVQVSDKRFRIPDICVLAADAPREQIVQYPPILCIEILSPEDTLSRMRDRIHDFIDMGVRQVWLLDPQTRTVIVCDGLSMLEQTSGEVKLPGSPVTIEVAKVFNVLDEA